MFVSLPASAEQDLAYGKEWLKLLHYKKQTFGGYKGLVAADKFYADKDGRYDPQKEMETEIRLFNANDKIKCEFPARFEWLKQKGLVRGDLKKCKGIVVRTYTYPYRYGAQRYANVGTRF